MAFLWDLFQQSQISDQATKTASLEQRVHNLEHQVRILHQIILLLAQDMRPELLKQFEVVATTATGWLVSRIDPANGLEVPLPSKYATEEEAKAEARRLLGDDPETQVYVSGSQGRRYRVLP